MPTSFAPRFLNRANLVHDLSTSQPLLTEARKKDRDRQRVGRGTRERQRRFFLAAAAAGGIL